ncbi:uncharacterized protein LOC113308621 [Papaver somniferum]|uniref:uncharacterized protein LOC113308621 n=1 Tax=Papaver somniferum TaxID=3469 RepID=UPI000E6FA93F|nr:uncharacterized protein LOC113308621 [Papaver somniferum]
MSNYYEREWMMPLERCMAGNLVNMLYKSTKPSLGVVEGVIGMLVGTGTQLLEEIVLEVVIVVWLQIGTLRMAIARTGHMTEMQPQGLVAALRVLIAIGMEMEGQHVEGGSYRDRAGPYDCPSREHTTFILRRPLLRDTSCMILFRLGQVRMVGLFVLVV